MVMNVKGSPMASKNRVKIFLKQNGKRIAQDTYNELDLKIRFLLLEAIKRSEKNKRSTIMAWDL